MFRALCYAIEQFLRFIRHRESVWLALSMARWHFSQARRYSNWIDLKAEEEFNMPGRRLNDR